MIIGLDVAQTCVERAGCAWYADALARALIDVGRERGHRFVLYHHFGDWINGDTARGTRVEDPIVSAPLQALGPEAARRLWADVEDGRKPLPGNPEVVFSFSFHAPRIPRAKLLYTVHDLSFWLHPDFATDATRLLCQREMLQALARAHAFLFVSDHSRTEFDRLFPGWLAATGRPWALALGASRFPTVQVDRQWSPEAPWLAVGSLEPRKNFAAVLDAYERYSASRERPRRLIFAGGRGWKSGSLIERIDSLARSGRPVGWLGYVSDAELHQLYLSSFALLCPSWHEGFGLPLVEALSAGLPALASSTGSLPEVGGDAARYVSPAAPAELAAAMSLLDDDPVLYNQLAAAARERAPRFDWKSTARSLLEFAESL